MNKSPYEYGRIAKLDEALRAAQVAPEIIAAIMQDGDSILKGTNPERKADWMRDAMQRMDQLLEPGVRQAVREACACCLGGKRLELVKAIAKKGGTLEERVQTANRTKMVFGNSVTLQDDGKIVVRFAPDETPTSRCVCLPQAKEPISATYCMCCGGHIKHHLQIALERSLAMEVRSSALSSGNKRTCSFLFTIIE
jgi:hypothetical protein